MAREEAIDLMIVSLGFGAFDGLRLCSQVRSHERTRNLPILLIADPDDRPKVLRGLELGVNDYLTRPIDRNELLARVRDQRPPEALRGSTAPVRAAIDRDGALRPADRAQQSPLARAPPAGDDRNRAPERRAADHDGSRHRPFQARERHLWSRRRRSRAQGLCRSAARDRSERRPHLPSGWGGIRRRDAGRRHEPSGADRGTRAPQPQRAAKFAVDGAAGSVSITVSIGLAEWRENWDSAELYRRADRALYLSKSAGRNRVTQDAA